MGTFSWSSSRGESYITASILYVHPALFLSTFLLLTIFVKLSRPPHPKPDGGPSKLDEQHSRFYAASVLIALGYMHSHEVSRVTTRCEDVCSSSYIYRILHTHTIQTKPPSSPCFSLLFSRSKIIYRALKPENIWLDAKGYIRLVNLESAKYVTHGDFTHTLCGIPEYMCPEMILGRGHRTGADWW